MCRRLLFQVRLNKPVPTVCFTKLPRDGFLVILLIFPIHFFFSSIFAAFAIQTKFIFSCDGITLLNHDGLEETEHIRIALRDFAKSLRELKNIFVQNRFFTFIVESIVSFISFSKGPWELNKTMCFITYSLKIWFIMTRSKQNWPLRLSAMEEEMRFISERNKWFYA